MSKNRIVVTFEASKDVARQASIVAAMQGVSRSELCRRALLEKLEKLPQVKVITGESNG